jgi:hypothetical protein
MSLVADAEAEVFGAGALVGGGGGVAAELASPWRVLGRRHRFTPWRSERYGSWISGCFNLESAADGRRDRFEVVRV